MANSPQHTFQILTKRPKRMRDFLRAAKKCEGGWLTHNGEEPLSYGEGGLVLNDKPGWPLPNVWLGTSIESLDYVDRADLVREAPAAIRFISAEPLLGPLVATPLDEIEKTAGPRAAGEEALDRINEGSPDYLDLTDIDWLIVGGESGKDHRPMDLDWVRKLRDACDRGETSFFYKQPGGATPNSGTRDLDGRTWDEFPEPVVPAASQGALI